MNTLSNIRPFQPQLPFLGLDSDQRSLVEYVSASPSVATEIRRRARALLLLDEGEPLADIALLVTMQPRTIRALIRRHRESGVRAALLRRTSTPSGARPIARAAKAA